MVKEIYIEDIKNLFLKREKDTNKGDFGKVGIYLKPILSGMSTIING